MTADFTNTVLFCEEARKRLAGRAAAARSACSVPWPANGAASRWCSTARRRPGLSRYLEGLDHKFRARGLRTVCVKPGFVKTGMTAGLKPPPFAGTPDEVARRVLRAIDRGWPEVYAPRPWRWVMCVIRRLPRFVMRRIGF